MYNNDKEVVNAPKKQDRKIVAPTKNIQKNINFIFNNLGELNLQTKVNIY